MACVSIAHNRDRGSYEWRVTGYGLRVKGYEFRVGTIRRARGYGPFSNGPYDSRSRSDSALTKSSVPSASPP